MQIPLLVWMEDTNHARLAVEIRWYGAGLLTCETHIPTITQIIPSRYRPEVHSGVALDNIW